MIDCSGIPFPYVSEKGKYIVLTVDQYPLQELHRLKNLFLVLKMLEAY